jgi:hypothetical protein
MGESGRRVDRRHGEPVHAEGAEGRRERRGSRLEDDLGFSIFEEQGQDFTEIRIQFIERAIAPRFSPSLRVSA